MENAITNKLAELALKIGNKIELIENSAILNDEIKYVIISNLNLVRQLLQDQYTNPTITKHFELKVSEGVAMATNGYVMARNGKIEDEFRTAEDVAKFGIACLWCLNIARTNKSLNNAIEGVISNMERQFVNLED